MKCFQLVCINKCVWVWVGIFWIYRTHIRMLIDFAFGYKSNTSNELQCNARQCNAYYYHYYLILLQVSHKKRLCEMQIIVEYQLNDHAIQSTLGNNWKILPIKQKLKQNVSNASGNDTFSIDKRSFSYSKCIVFLPKSEFIDQRTALLVWSARCVIVHRI